MLSQFQGHTELLRYSIRNRSTIGHTLRRGNKGYWQDSEETNVEQSKKKGNLKAKSQEGCLLQWSRQWGEKNQYQERNFLNETHSHVFRAIFKTALSDLQLLPQVLWRYSIRALENCILKVQLLSCGDSTSAISFSASQQLKSFS